MKCSYNGENCANGSIATEQRPSLKNLKFTKFELLIKLPNSNCSKKWLNSTLHMDTKSWLKPFAFLHFRTLEAWLNLLVIISVLLITFYVSPFDLDHVIVFRWQYHACGFGVFITWLLQVRGHS